MHSSRSSCATEAADALPDEVRVCGVRLVLAPASRDAGERTSHDSGGRLLTAFHLVGEVQGVDGLVHWYYASLDGYDRKKIRVEDDVVAAAAVAATSSADSPQSATAAESLSVLTADTPKIFLRLGRSNTFRRYVVPTGLSPGAQTLLEAITTLPHHDVARGPTTDTCPLHTDGVYGAETAQLSWQDSTEADVRDDVCLPAFASAEGAAEDYHFPEIFPLWSSSGDAFIDSLSHPSLAMAREPADPHASTSTGRMRYRSSATASAIGVADDDDDDALPSSARGGAVAGVASAARRVPLLRRPDGSRTSASSSLGQSTLHEQASSSGTRLIPQRPSKSPRGCHRRPIGSATTTVVPTIVPPTHN